MLLSGEKRMFELHRAIVRYDKETCSLCVWRDVKDIGQIKVMNIKLDAQCASIVGRAIQAANSGYEPDCFMLAFGMADAAAFDASAWTDQPHHGELK